MPSCNSIRTDHLDTDWIIGLCRAAYEIGREAVRAMTLLKYRYVLLVTALGIFATIGLAVWLLIQAAPAEQSPGGPFTLTDPSGKTVTDRDFRGKFMLIYFGYTNCPDICPTTLYTVAKALNLMGKQGDLIQPIFITVDPARDTPVVMGRYTALFSCRLIGLSGRPADIRQLEREFDIYVGPEDPRSGIIKHSAMLYLIDRHGNYIGSIYDDSTSTDLARELAEIMIQHPG